MRKAGRKREIRSPLQAVFLKRVQEELDRQKLSRNQLASRVGAPPQTTLNDVMLGADPRLETVHQIATALGVSAVSLLTEIRRGTVINLPSYPQISGQADDNHKKKSHDRKRARG